MKLNARWIVLAACSTLFVGASLAAQTLKATQDDGAAKVSKTAKSSKVKTQKAEDGPGTSKGVKRRTEDGPGTSKGVRQRTEDGPGTSKGTTR